MTLADGLITWLHLICASIWVGGSIFLGIVLSPMLRTITKTVEERIIIMIKVGRRFNKIAIPSFAILILTGLYSSRPFFQQPNTLFETTYGLILIIKIILVIVTLTAYILHIKVLSTKTENRIATGNMNNIYLQFVRSKIIILGRIIVILSLAILLLAALLDSGGIY